MVLEEPTKRKTYSADEIQKIIKDRQAQLEIESDMWRKAEQRNIWNA